jgi:hypothetical protein
MKDKQEMTWEMVLVLQKLCKIAYQLDRQGHHLFVGYIAHVRGIDIDLHINGWESGRECDYMRSFYSDTSNLPELWQFLDDLISFIQEKGINLND